MCQAQAALLHGQRTIVLLQTCSGLEATRTTAAASDQDQGTVLGHAKVRRVRELRPAALAITETASADPLTNGTKDIGAFSTAGIAGIAFL